jgi:hypothetical protein
LKQLKSIGTRLLKIQLLSKVLCHAFYAFFKCLFLSKGVWKLAPILLFPLFRCLQEDHNVRHVALNLDWKIFQIENCQVFCKSHQFREWLVEAKIFLWLLEFFGLNNSELRDINPDRSNKAILSCKHKRDCSVASLRHLFRLIIVQVSSNHQLIGLIPVDT